MGFWGTLGKIGAGIAAPFTGGASLAAIPAIDAIGAGLGAFSQGQAQNRGAKFQGQMDLEQLLMARDQQGFNNAIAREQEGRAGSSDALRKLFATGHLLNPGARPQLSPYSVAPRQASDAERTGASALQAEVLARLQGGNPIAQFQQRPLSVDPKLLNAGVLERIFGAAAPVLTALGAPRKEAA